MSTVVHVKNISPQTSEKEVQDFFSFCGKITKLSVTPESDAANSPKTATVTFEKETAAKTALLLDNTQLGSSQVQVSSGAGLSDIASSATAAVTGSGSGKSESQDEDIAQEDKPRSRIVAEYLAHGYVLTDKALQNAISLDNKHGISERFTSALSNFDNKYKASDRARGIDQSYGISATGGRAWAGLSSYFEKAMGTPSGQRVATFYTQADKQIKDIHTEAKRLADIKAGRNTFSTAGAGAAGAGEGSVHHIPGSDKTTCQCGGDDGHCPCATGQCACNGCSKSKAGESHTATGAADSVAKDTKVAPIGEKTV